MMFEYGDACFSYISSRLQNNRRTFLESFPDIEESLSILEAMGGIGSC